MDDVEPYSNGQVTATDVKAYCFFHTELFFGCCAKMRFLPAFDAVVSLWEKKRLGEMIDASSCIEETGASAHKCSANAIADTELTRWFGP